MNNILIDINEKYTKYGSLLRELRISKNLTQIEMAKKLKVTQPLISQMENGYCRITLVTAKRIEKLFDIDYRCFLENSDNDKI